MKSGVTKLAAAVIIIAVVLSITISDKSAAPAWAIEQTVDALSEIRTLIITGSDRYGTELVPFKCWIVLNERESTSDPNDKFLKLRYECDRKTVVVRGNVAYEYWHKENIVTIKQGPVIDDLKFWYKAAELSPWITGRVLQTLKSFTGDWKETYGRYGKESRECVFVTCSYRPLSASFSFVCDLETKLIVEGKHWRDVYRVGPPNCHAENFIYNPPIPDEIFDFKIPEGARVTNKEEQKEANTLFERGEKLFEEKETIQAMKVFQEIYEKYSDLTIAESALMMIGICYERMGHYEKAIETYQKSISEYPNLKGWIESTYFYLGCAYMKTGQKDKALEAFKNCLIMGEGIRAPDKFPLKHAREYIEKLRSRE